MESGFDHFDGAHRENFLSALLLLAMEVDPDVKTLIEGLVRPRASRPNLGHLLRFGREAWLTETIDGSRQRSDLWLSFEEGVVLVEVKTRGDWIVDEVTRQLRNQEASGMFKATGQPVRGAVLLAPWSLQKAWGKAFIPWTDVISGFQRLEGKSAISAVALTHLETHVEKPMGFQNKPVADFETGIRTIASLRALLQACARSVGGRVEAEPLFLTSEDGEPRPWQDGWAGFGLAVPWTLDRARYRVGIYKYSATPPERERWKEGAWLEAFVEDGGYRHIFEIPFDAGDLSPEALERVHNQFAACWNEAKGKTAPGAGQDVG